MPHQSLLEIPVLQPPDMANYVAGKNQQLIDLFASILAKLKISASVGYASLYIWGETAGHTHLLHAFHDLAQQKHIKSICLSLQHMIQPERVFADMGSHYQLIMLDDLEAGLRDQATEQALLCLFHEVSMHNRLLVLSSHLHMDQCAWMLPDLKTRMQSGLVWQLQPLDDMEQKQLFKTYITRYGFAVQDAVIDYLWTRLSRNPHEQLAALKQLMQQALQYKQKINMKNMKKFLDDAHTR